MEISLPAFLEISFIFVFTIVFMIKIGKDEESLRRGMKHVFFIVLAGGILLDCYSIFPPGTFILSLLFSRHLAKIFLLKFNTNKPLSILIFGFLISFIYHLLVSVFAFSLSLFFPPVFKIYFNGFYWLDIFRSVWWDGLLISFFSWGLRIIRAKRSLIRNNF